MSFAKINPENWALVLILNAAFAAASYGGYHMAIMVSQTTDVRLGLISLVYYIVYAVLLTLTLACDLAVIATVREGAKNAT